MMHNEYHREWSLRNKLKSSICCFTGTVHAHAHQDHHQSLDDADLFYNKLNKSKTPRTPSSPISPASWLKKSTTNDSVSGGSARSRNCCLLSRRARKYRRQSVSADFSYDPSSYALNFEDQNRADDDEFPFRDFASRLRRSPSLPRSPPRQLFRETTRDGGQRDCWL